MRVLALSLGVPFPPVGGGLARTYHLLQALASHHEIVLAAFSYGEPHDPPPFPVRVETVAWQWSRAYLEMVGDDPAASTRAYQYLTWEADEPWLASVLDPAPMEAALRRLLEERVDVILLEGTPLTKFLPVLPWGVPRVLDFYDVHSLMARREAAAANGDSGALAHEAERTLRWERRAVRQCNACVTVSDAEATAARTLLEADPVHVIPTGVDTTYFAPQARQSQRGAVLFTGTMNYPPNVDAACHFAGEILPLVKREAPHATFHVVGTNPTDRVARLASDSVVVYGRVPDMRPHFANAEVVVAPIRAGGGTKLKLLEAGAAGKAIVSTSFGVEGLPFKPDRDLLVADSPAGFAAAVVRLLDDPARRAELGAHARAVACRYDWQAIGNAFRQIIERCARP